jgi:cytochrome c peroxidase
VEHPFAAMVISGGAPTAIALSADDNTAYVFCRSTYDVQEVPLRQPGVPSALGKAKDAPRKLVTIAEDNLDAEAAKGRKLFYDATDSIMSGGLGCAGCHPDGRDDGHVWHEIAGEDATFSNGYRGATVLSSLQGGLANEGKGGTAVGTTGNARQTPMLAGRVSAAGPYGWLGESPNLESRLRVGFSLHRWQGDKNAQYVAALDRPKQLARFIREGLSEPPVDAHEPTAEELRGKQLFEDAKTACSTCHASRTGFTDRSLVLLSRPAHKGFAEETAPFKTPSLLFVGGTPPYFHDGASGSLEDLVDKNGTQMGNTAALNAADKRALAAYLRTLGGYVAPFPEEAPPVRPKIDPGNVDGLGRRPDHGFWRGIKDAPFPNGGGCSVRREGAWFHVTCPKVVAGIQLLAGTVAGTETWFGQREDFVGSTGHLVFPLREGDRKVFQFTQEVSLGRWGSTYASLSFVQVEWVRGQAEPTLLFTMP